MFDNVEIPRRNVFIDGNLDVYYQVMGVSPWWPNIMQQTTTRALTKLEFADGLRQSPDQRVDERVPAGGERYVRV